MGPEFRVWFMVVVPHRSTIRRVEENRRTDCRYVPIAKKLIVIFPVPCRVKRPNTPIVAQQPALHIVMTAFRSLMRFPPGFTNCKHLARHSIKVNPCSCRELLLTHGFGASDGHASRRRRKFA